MSRPGFATALAVAMLALVGLAMLTLTRHFADVAQHTADVRRQAQLRQLQHAAVSEVRSGLSEEQSKRQGQMSLPDVPELHGLGLRWERAGEAGDEPGGVTMVLTASADDTRSRVQQTVGFERGEDGTWRLRAAELEQHR